MKKNLLSIFFVLFGILVFAQDGEYEAVLNIPYYSESVNLSDKYISERCVLDIYYPKNTKDFPTVVWFHGGGLAGGNKYMPENLREEGICIIAVNYRLHPKSVLPFILKMLLPLLPGYLTILMNMGGIDLPFLCQGIQPGDILP